MLLIVVNWGEAILIKLILIYLLQFPHKKHCVMALHGYGNAESCPGFLSATLNSIGSGWFVCKLWICSVLVLAPLERNSLGFYGANGPVQLEWDLIPQTTEYVRSWEDPGTYAVS